MITFSWKPDKHKKESIYSQIITYITQHIMDGSFPAGERLPSQRTLAAQFEVNRSTIVSAMEELHAMGMIQTLHGGGTVICANAWSVMLSHSNTDWNNYVQTGSFYENLPEIQQINRTEFSSHIVRLGTGEPTPSLFPVSLWQQALGAVANQLTNLNYLEPKGLYELRAAIAERFTKRGCPVSAEHILITSGSLQALQLISVGMLPKNSTVFSEAPTYLKSLQLFPSAGLSLRGIPMDKEGIQYWLLPQQETGKSILYTIPTNQNPTGITMSLQRRLDLLQYCASHRIPIVEDGAYDELWFTKEPPAPLKVLDSSNNVVYLGTISKTLAPGLRIGWLIGPPLLIERLSDIKMQMDYGASSLAQYALLEFFRTGGYDSYLATLRDELLARRNAACDALTLYFAELADWTVPEGGFYIWLQFRRPVPINKLFQKALSLHILVNPGTIYDYTQNHALRLSYAYVDSTAFKKALKQLAALVHTLL